MGMVPLPSAVPWPAWLGLGTELGVSTICSLFFAIMAPTGMGAGQAGHGCRGGHLESPESPPACITLNWHLSAHCPPNPAAAFRSSVHTLPLVPTRQHPSGLCHCPGAGQAHLPPPRPWPLPAATTPRDSLAAPLNPLLNSSFPQLPPSPPWECKYTLTLKICTLALSPYATSV